MLRFGDATTTDKTVFPFYPDRPCYGFEEVLKRYTEITPNVKLSGPTSFAPLIRGPFNCSFSFLFFFFSFFFFLFLSLFLFFFFSFFFFLFLSLSLFLSFSFSVSVSVSVSVSFSLSLFINLKILFLIIDDVEAIRICQTQKSYHILVIIADGQVDSIKETANAIVEATNYPLYITSNRQTSP
jgi:hypothetical protein